MSGNHGPAIHAALAEAFRKFGTPNPHNAEQIARWVKRRVHELAGDPAAEVTPFDAKAAAASANRDE